MDLRNTARSIFYEEESDPVADTEASEPRTPRQEGITLWAIYDRQTNKPYVRAGWPLAEAQEELQTFLRPYSQGHEWRKRLYLKEWKTRRKRSIPEGEES